MGVLGLSIDDELDTKWRETVFRSRGKKKGALTPALEEAINDWIAKVEKEEKQRGTRSKSSGG